LLRVWILERHDLTLTGKTALEMVAYFLGRGVFSAHPLPMEARMKIKRGFIWRC
jgi:hypothetical protein